MKLFWHVPATKGQIANICPHLPLAVNTHSVRDHRENVYGSKIENCVI